MQMHTSLYPLITLFVTQIVRLKNHITTTFQSLLKKQANAQAISYLAFSNEQL